MGAVLLDLLLLLDRQAGPSPCPSRRRALSLTPHVRTIHSGMLRVADPALTGQPVRGEHAAGVSLLPGAQVLRPTSSLAVVGAADLLLLAVVLRHLDALEGALTCSFASLPALA